ncbi:MAG: GntR family transcriptional regulator [Chloroflexota bacterium]
MPQLPSLEHFNNKSLRERILDTLKSAILSGELKPGQTLVETDLASQLGVSRAPLREAIQILNSEGLVSTVPYHGTTVTKLTRTDIEELYSLRSVMESFAIQRILEQHHPTAVTDLQAIYERMIAAANDNNWRDLNMLDREFHDTIITLSGHSLLASTWNTVQMRVQQVMSLHNLRNRNIVQVANNHLPIINAITANDLPLATRVIQQHIASTGDLIAEGWHVDEDAS